MVKQTANIVRVYDQDGKKLAYLQNAYEINYDLKLNTLWYAGFTLPADDPKNAYCQPFNLVEIYDNGQRIELFRILPSQLTRNTQGDIVYTCEHVLATLIDDVLFQYHQIGNLGVYTNQVLQYVLDRQTTGRWQLADCDFRRQFEYKWENETLLAALFSVPKCFDEDYRWEFDTTAYPWQLSLKRLPHQRKAEIRYGKNMLEIIKDMDPSNIVTRLFCLGYGEGDNQLNICSVNNGLPYLDAPTMSIWGMKQNVLVDRRFENPESLMAYGQAQLDKLQHPYISYTVKAVDLHRLDPNKHARFWPGDIVHVVDKADDIVLDAPIVRVRKKDVTGDPGSVEVQVANQPKDIAGSISELYSRARINELYAQGATNQMMVNYADNADPTHPAVLRLYIPDTMVRINKCVLHYELEPFRGYTRAIEGAPQQTETTSTSPQQVRSTSSDVINISSTENSPVEVVTSDFESTSYGTISQIGFVRSVDPHNHGITNNTRLAVINQQNQIIGHTTFVESGGHYHDNYQHRHRSEVPAHDHRINIPSHDHTIQLPAHDHTLIIPAHNHDMAFGIHEGETANSISIVIDGQYVSVADGEIDIVNYLAVDGGGKIQRNTWHTIQIIPDRMSRIIANIFMQIFTNSRGGGDY